mgnify:CR=1 FL=1
MSIIDRRASNKNKSVGNRRKFIERNKERIKRYIENKTSTKGITDAVEDREIVMDDINEPNFNFDHATGERDFILPGNKDMEKGDRIYAPPKKDAAGSQGSDTGDGLDEFAFTLTQEEFLELYFSDLKLPNFIKTSMKGSNKWKFKRSGYSKEGIPARLDLLKTLKQSMARRIATRKPCSDEDCIGGTYGNKYLYETCDNCAGTGYEPARYLDDIDLRYKHFTKKPYPVRQAVMICLMDVSGSMGEFEKELAKKFYLLLYLFLNKCYTGVEVIFISHTQEAREVTEHEFFHSRETGGTIVSSGLQLTKDIIDKRIDTNTTNVYIAQASDGDNWESDDALTVDLVESLLSSVQYFAYIQTEEPDRIRFKEQYRIKDLLSTYEEIATRYKHLQARRINDAASVYPVLRSLFEGE